MPRLTQHLDLLSDSAPILFDLPLLWDNTIPKIKIGKKFLIDPADLSAFVEREKAAR